MGKQASHAETKGQPLAQDKIDDSSRLAWLRLLFDIGFPAILRVRGHGDGLRNRIDSPQCGLGLDASLLASIKQHMSVESDSSRTHYQGTPSRLSGSFMPSYRQVYCQQ
jgi:hypothetical protein